MRYFAARYDFTILGTVLPSTSTMTEANPGQLEDLATAIESAGVPAIFTEALGTDTDARALADRLGVAVVELTTDTLGRSRHRHGHVRGDAAHHRRTHRRCVGCADRRRLRQDRVRGRAVRPVGLVGRTVRAQRGDAGRARGRRVDGGVHVGRRHVGGAPRDELPGRCARPRGAAGRGHRLRARGQHHRRGAGGGAGDGRGRQRGAGPISPPRGCVHRHPLRRVPRARRRDHVDRVGELHRRPQPVPVRIDHGRQQRRSRPPAR